MALPSTQGTLISSRGAHKSFTFTLRLLHNVRDVARAGGQPRPSILAKGMAERSFVSEWKEEDGTLDVLHDCCNLVIKHRAEVVGEEGEAFNMETGRT